ncbi:MAG: hypothetical protein SPF92_08500 [Clostridia bacterium]|nr:hypothetical protein [Clostridia bacterium]
MEFNFTVAVPLIALLCYLIIEGIKIIFGKHEKVKELLPLISSFVGGILGILLFAIYPEIISAGSYADALILGIFSGLGATGSNQIFKQCKNFFDSLDK